jgi:TolA-binding protein
VSPKSVVYKANSIIYFKGDASEKIFLLDEGKVSLGSVNIETGQEVHELIKTGEFFGVKSALGRYPREETALVLTDSKVVAFTVPEFELVASKNSGLIIKMLKVFSNQLRRIHKQVQNLISSEDHVVPEIGLYKISDYYLRAKKYSQAIYVLKQYLVYYPSGKYADAASKNIRTAEDYMQKYGQGKGPETTSGVAHEVGKPAKAREVSGTEKQYYNAVTLMGETKYKEAFAIFQAILSSGQDDEYTLKARFETGKCLYYIGQFDACIKTFSGLMQKYPKHPDLAEALFFIGQCTEKKSDSKKAMDIYKKVLTMIPESSQLYNQANSALRRIERAHT